MRLEREESSAMTALRIGRKVGNGMMCFYVKPSSRRSNTMVEAKGHDGFDFDQALIELFGRLGVV